MTAITNEDKLREVMRELQFRADVYDRWIAQGLISVGEAQMRKDILRAIASDYAVLLDEEYAREPLP